MSAPIQNETKKADQPDNAASSEGFRDKNGLFHGTLSKKDYEADFQFEMRGNSLNPLIDAAHSLFAMVIHLRRIVDPDDADKLYPIVRDQILSLIHI